MKRAVIFDLDGTLSDSIRSIQYSADKALAEFGLGPFPVEDYKYFVGDGAAKLVERCLLASGDRELSLFDRVYPRYREIFRENCMYQVKPYRGIPEVLGALRERRIAAAVLSNKPHRETVEVIGALFGEGCFERIQGQEEGLARKPSPEGVFRILEGLGLLPNDALYVGDTCTDMRTGKSAGVFTLGALWGFRDRRELEENGADAVLENPLEILDYIG